MSTSIKLDINKVNKNIKRVNEIFNDLKMIINSKETVLDNIVNLYNKIIFNQTQKVLENISVDEFSKSKKGIRISALKENNIENIAQLNKMNFKQLCSLSGIGEDNAENILEITKEFYKSARVGIKIRFDLDNLSNEEFEIIKGIYIKDKLNPLIKKSSEIYNEHIDEVNKLSINLSPCKNSFSWLFASKQKKEIAKKASDFLDNILEGTSYIYYEYLLKSYNKLNSFNKEEVLEDFKINSAGYYTYLAQIYPEIGKDDSHNLSEDLLDKINSFELDTSLMKATLRPYQEFGVKYSLYGEKTLLGDEMGLGKTFQAMAAFAHLQAKGKSRFLVVCPLSVLINWVREIEKHSHLKALKIHRNSESELLEWIMSGGVAITTYETISKFNLPADMKIDLLVSDEAHYIKNKETKRAISFEKLRIVADKILLMTGTPIENNVDEMCYLISCLNTDISNKIETMKHLSMSQDFKKTIAEVYLRRTRDAVLTELPDLIEAEEWCEINKREEEMYKISLEESNFMAMRQISWNVSDIMHSNKALRLLEIIKHAKEENRKVLVFSFFRNTLKKLETLLKDDCLETITGDVPVDRRQGIIDEFTEHKGFKILLSQVIAGGTGLNIQAASIIVFCEPQIKPSIENQAISRAYRMGQTRNVLVYRLLSEAGIDKRMAEILYEKQNIFDAFANESEIGEESLEQAINSNWINSLIKEEKEKIANGESLAIEDDDEAQLERE